MEIGSRTTGGLVRVYVTSAGTNYTEPPDVVISGNGTAVAHLRQGRVESIVIGNAGTGYATSAPTVSIAPKSSGVTISSLTAGTSSATLTLSSPAATTFARIAAGTDSQTITQFANATQIVIGATTFAGSGQATLYAAGTGAAAAAFAYTGALRPLSFFKGRFSDLYGVDGMGRGFRWNGSDSSVEQIGINKPAVGPALTASSTGVSGFVSRIQLVQGGAGYHTPPTVTITGGTPSENATARALVSNGRVSSVIVTNRGAGYQGTPTVAFSGGVGSGAAFTVAVAGRVASVLVTASGSGYTTTPAITGSSASSILTCNHHGLSAGSTFRFESLAGGTGVTTGVDYYVVTASATTFTAATTTGGATNIFTSNLTGTITIPPASVSFGGAGLTGALGTVNVDSFGRVSGIQVLAGGTGATTTGAAATISGGGGTGATVVPEMQYSVTGVSVANSGSGYFTAPVITFRAATNDPSGSGAAVTANVNNTGNISGASLVSGGNYDAPPTAIILDTAAKAQATVAQAFQGKYQCAIRYIDDTPTAQRGPIPSSISDLIEVDISSPSGSLTWTLSHYGVDSRVSAVELWRSTTDQKVSLFRIATIKKTDPDWAGQYVDSFSDPDLIDTTRDGFAVMPIVLPSGQLNARRFGVPPGELAVATMFQDRAWYAVDITGEKANSLYYSETDEPESVPLENELVVQDNTLEPDRIVGLIPFGTQLLIAQTARLHALSYVSQPVLDASIMLVAYRGILNSRCGDVLTGAAVMADSFGMYAFDGNNTEAISVPVDNYWRENIIDFSKADKFHVRADSATMTVRFFYCRSGDSDPIRALCYCFATKAWWEETYATPVTASCTTVITQKAVVLHAGADGVFRKSAGLTDSGSAVPYQLRTGNLTLSNEKGDRSLAFVYTPTSSDSTLNVALHYNNATSPRPNAISSDTGSGFTTVHGSTVATLNMNKSRSSLGDSNGFAQAHYSGRVDDRSAGGDKHVAVDVGGTQSSDAVTLYAMRVAGAE
jgi:hypothetical protein